MGGLGSGRKRRHTCIDDCLTIDASWLRKWKPGAWYDLSWGTWKETDFAKRTETKHYAGAVLSTGESATLRLFYSAKVSFPDGTPQQEQPHSHRITLTSTPCHYGGRRWWFIAPCCRSRVRILYISLKAGDVERMTPQCRNCLELHYASQMQSYIERHITYEKHLLSNYGYTWARLRYQALKEHYFEVTPEYAYRARKSEYEHTLHMVKLLIRFNRLMYKSYLRSFLSLKREEDRVLYLELVKQEMGEDSEIVLTLQACLPMDRSENTPEVREQLLQVAENDERGQIARWRGLAEDLREEMERLKPAA